MEILVKTFNVHCGGVRYDWSGRYDIQSELAPFEEDIIVLQESLNPDRFGVNFPDSYQIESTKLFPEMLTLDDSGNTIKDEGHLILASRLPIRNLSEIPVRRYGKDPRDRVICAVVEKDNVLVNVIAVHLTTSLLPLGSFLQAIELAKSIPKGPTIVLGDHNLWRVPLKYAYREKLEHAGRGASWPSRRPVHQIDHIWTNGFVVQKHTMLPSLGSDHLGVKAHLSLKI
ncbi:MAG: endonuclease/exonuclease/phosphatase family protein [Candidatus Paceibacterota bacterium]